MKIPVKILIPAILLTACAQRDEGVGSRSNPYDAGGDSWTINALPEITGIPDSGWVDFNYTDSTGTLRLRIHASDRNIPYDTLEYTVTLTSSGKSSSTTTRDTVVQFDNLKTGTAYRCSVFVADRQSGTSAHAFTGTTPPYAPPPRPHPYIVSGTSYLSLYWQTVDGADEYHVFSSDNLQGPYAPVHRINQPASGTVTVTDTPASYAPTYYLVAASNSFGISFASDTLLGRRCYSGLPTPSISSVSQGTYTNHISLSIQSSYLTSVRKFEIYRSMGDTVSFRLIGSVANPYPNGSYGYFNDTVNTGLTCYYKAAAIDTMGRGGRMSPVKYGFTQRLHAPSSLSARAVSDYITLSWYSVSGAEYYAIYRSDTSCSSGMTRIDSVTSTTYRDTLTSSSYYYYSISGVDRNGREGTRSSCAQAKLTILSAPSILTASNGTYPRHIVLSWKAVSGAEGYILYRSDDLGSTYAPVDSTAATTCSDTVDNVKIYYYRVAGYTMRGIGDMSSFTTGVTLQPPLLTTSASNFTLPPVKLSWTAKAGALMYYIHRSTDTSTAGFICIDSTTASIYWDTLPDYRRYYYRLSMRVADGVTNLGTMNSWMRETSAPTGLYTTDTDSGCLITWNNFPGADSYRLYRSVSSSSYSVYKEVSDTSCFDTLTTSDRYYYRVDAHIGNRYSPISKYVSGGTLTTPLTPVGISVKGTPLDIVISWDMPSNSSTPDGYIIYRNSSTIADDFFILDSTSARVYHDSVPNTLPYTYAIASYNSKGSSTRSTTYRANRTGPSSPVSRYASQGTYASKIVISWSRVTPATGYQCYRSTTSTGSYILIATTGDTVVTDTTCTPNIMYYYKIASFTDALLGTMSSYVAGMRLGPPASITVTPYVYGIRISWSSSSYPVARYYIYRSDSPEGTYSKIDSTTITSYIDSSALEGNNYYKVSARNSDETPLTPVFVAGHVLPPAPVSGSRQ